MKNQTNNQNQVNTVITTADELFTKRENFEARSNKELYGILSEVYALYKSAETNDCLDDSVKQMKVALTERGIKTQSNTPKMTVFVRYIFNTDRKRSYKYTQTLLAALQAEIAPNALTDFITNNNGVEEIKRKHSLTDKQQQKINVLNNAIPLAKAQLETMQSVQTVKFDDSVTLSDDTDFAFVIARVGANGELELLRTVPKTTVGMQNAAIKLIAQQNVEQQSEKAAETQKATTDELVSDAAASITVRDEQVQQTVSEPQAA